MYLEDIILIEVTQSQKKSLDMHTLISRYAKHKKIKKREDQWVDSSFLLRIGNKIPMKGVTKIKFGAKTKGWTAPPGGPSHIQPLNTDTIAYASKIFLKGP